MHSLEEHGDNGIDARSKVRYLNDGIKTTRLDTIKATILSSSDYRSDFDSCVTLYKDFIKQSDMQPELKISAVDTDASTGDKSGNGGGGKSKGVTDRYYKRSE